MYGVIRRFNVTDGNAHRVVTKIQGGYAREVAALQGFVTYHLVDAGDGTLVSASLFETREDADAAQHHAAAWVKAHLAGMLRTSPVIVAGEVKALVGLPNVGPPAPPPAPRPTTAGFTATLR